MNKPGIGDTSLTEVDPGLEKVFRLVEEREGVDLRSYRRSTLEHRVASRFQKLRCQSYEEYAALLAGDPAESRRLIEHVTIKVSRFFRDAPVFARLRAEVLPELGRRGSPPQAGELRVWSAGCGYGEEAYSLAILAREVEEAGLCLPEVTILGTDLDDGALAVARQGSYPEAALAETPATLAASYFSRREGRYGPQYQLLAAPRENVRFGHHDLLSGKGPERNGPFDLVLCRNVLIYFSRPAQERVLCLLAASVDSGGYLCLGEAEHLTAPFMSAFRTVDRQARLYRKI